MDPNVSLAKSRRSKTRRVWRLVIESYHLEQQLYHRLLIHRFDHIRASTISTPDITPSVVHTQQLQDIEVNLLQLTFESSLEDLGSKQIPGCCYNIA